MKMEQKCLRSIENCLTCTNIQECKLVEKLVKHYFENNDTNVEKSVHPKNVLNHLDGGEWLYFTKTLWTTAYPREFSHDLRKKHGANKPPRLMQRLVEFFTREDEHILDPFAGVGGTLIGAALCARPRRCTGIEINPRWIEIYKQVIAENPGLRAYPILQGDCVQTMKKFPRDKFHFIATDPPYNTHFKQTMCTGRYAEQYANRRTDYCMRSGDERDLANAAGYQAYLQAMEAVFKECFRVLAAGRYMAVVLRNAYQDGRYIFTHVDLAKKAASAGFIPKGEIVWYQAGTRLRPYGYPFAYVPNIAHQFILILRKPK